jgi:hypothetical protein
LKIDVDELTIKFKNEMKKGPIYTQEELDNVCPVCFNVGRITVFGGYWYGCPSCNPDDKMEEANEDIN